MVTAPPPEIRLTFNEPVQPIGRGIRVVAPSGKRVERGPARATGRGVSVDVDAPEQGTYVVNWRVVSADAQPERGRFTFTVGRPTATVTALSDDRRTVSRSGFVLAVVGRALHFLGYAFGFGSLAFRWLVLRPLAVPRVDTFDRALWRLTRFGVMALVFAEPLVVLGHALRLGISGDADVLADVLASRVGLVTGQRLGIALALWAVLAALETGSSTSLKLGLALGIALAVIDGQAVHAVSARPLAAGLVTNALHVAAMGTWVGTVVALLVVWRDVGVTPLRAAIARQAGRVAATALLVVMGSGTVLSFQHLTGTGDLASTFYGHVIVAKVAALIVMLAFALAGRRKGVGMPERWWQAELAAFVAVLLLAAVLVSLPPPA